MKYLQVIDRILYKLDDLVRPYVHKILVVIEPLLIDEDYYARVEGEKKEKKPRNKAVYCFGKRRCSTFFFLRCVGRGGTKKTRGPDACVWMCAGYVRVCIHISWG